jgi:predicted DsbA family dithiol-disulfide isomerase
VAVPVHYFTDPACPLSWGNEPNVRRLTVEFGDSLEWRFVMGGLARDYAGRERKLLAAWAMDAGSIEMPVDPLLWSEGGISSTYPACMGVKAAAEQGVAAETRFLRSCREGLLCFRRKLDSLGPLVEEARRAGWLDVERFRVDAGSHAIVEAFGADLELARDAPPGSPREDRVPFPTMRLGDDGWIFGRASYDELARAAEGAGAVRTPVTLSVDEAFARFERLAAKEVEVLCGLPGPRAHAELWRRASEWQLKALRVGAGGWLFERA